MKDQFNRLNVQRQPGPLADMLGGRVEQYYALDDQDQVSVSGATGSGSATFWAEMLSASAPDTRITLRYGRANGWLDGKPAAITRAYGKGSITYLGALLDPALMTAFVDGQLADAGVARGLAVPEGVEAMTREGAGKRVTILVNHGATTQHVSLPTPMTDVLSGGQKTDIPLAPEGITVLEQQGRH
jgi:beta-galactosidase